MARKLSKNGETPLPPGIGIGSGTGPPTPPMRQIRMNPERQMMLRIWALEDEIAEVLRQNAELQLANAELQTALAKATENPSPMPSMPGPCSGRTAFEQCDV